MRTLHQTFPARIAQALALLALVAIPFAAAQEQEQQDQQQQDQQQPQQRTALRVAHLAPDGPTVDVLVDGEVLVQGLAPNSVSGYLFLSPGDHELEVVSAAAAAPAEGEQAPEDAPPEGGAAQDGAPQDGAADGGVAGDPATDPAAPDPAAEAPAQEQAEPLLTQSVTLDPETYATLALAGSGQQAEQQQEDGGEDQQQQEAQQDGFQFEARLMTDGFQNLPVAGRSLVRVVHAAPAADQVTVVAAPSESEQQQQEQEQQQEEQEQEQQEEQQDEQQQQDQEQQEQQEGEQQQQVQGEPIASGLAFGDASEYGDLRAGSHHVQVQTSDGEVAVDLSDMQFESGVVYTLFVAGTQGGELVLTPAVDAGVRAQGR